MNKKCSPHSAKWSAHYQEEGIVCEDFFKKWGFTTKTKTINSSLMNSMIYLDIHMHLQNILTTNNKARHGQEMCKYASQK